VTNSTFYDNDANTGSGIDVAGGGSATLVSSTLVGDPGADIGAGAAVGGGTRATLAADLITNGCGSPVTDAGYNVDTDGTCGFSAAGTSTSDSTALGDYLGQYGEHGGP